MSDVRKPRRALLSVYDKTGLVEFARALHDEFGTELISTGGTAKVLKDAGLPVTLVEEVTGFPEMMDGRVKTLHPKIHAAILADRDNPEHMRQLKEQGIEPIDMVVVNLYPFEKTIARPECTFAEAIEMIDIGGPCLLRAAAKNHKHVLVLSNPEDCNHVLTWLRGDGLTNEGWDKVRRDYAWLAFELVSRYDARITAWLTDGRATAVHLRAACDLRYGENPIQTGSVCVPASGPEPDADSHQSLGHWRPRTLPWAGFGLNTNATEMSFNNYVDATAAFELCAELTRTGMGIAKLRFAARAGTAKLRFATGAGTAKLRFAAQGTSQPPETAESQLSRRVLFDSINDDLLQRRNLPHWQRPGATYWITFSSAIGDLQPAERDIAMAALRHWDGTRMDLLAAVVMRDHVHAILAPREIPEHPGEFYNLSALLKSIKGFSGREISQGRGGTGQVWTRESFDRWIRSENDLAEKYRYLAENVVKEGLAATPGEYKWWYALDVLGIGIGMPVREDPRTARGAGAAASGKPEVGIFPSSSSKPEVCSPREPEGCSPDKAERCAPPAVCFIKHTNACGAAIDADPIEAYRRAYLGDPNAAMGGILAVNFPVTPVFAEVVLETYAHFGKPLKDAGAPYAPGGFFVEVWLAPSFDDEAVRIIRGEVEGKPKKDWGQRVRLLAVGDMDVEPDPNELDYKRIAGGMLVQTRDLIGLNEDQWHVVTQRRPDDAQMDDLRLAWLVCKHTKSNAITICRDGTLLGNGAGQMSRVMSCRIATWLARENGHAEQLQGAVAASDAFFPFRDGPDILIDAGVTALIQPGGSKRDADVIAACNERGVTMIFTGTRHFKH